MTKHLISNKSLNKTTKKIGKHINATSNYLGNEVVEVKNNLVSNYKKNTFTWNISLLILVIICYLILIKNKPIIKLSDLLVNPIYLFKNQVQPMSMKRPFLNIYDDKGNKTNVVFITHPFTRDECIVQYNEAKKKGNHFLGMSSYCEFPAIVSNPHDVLHDPTIDAWAKYDQIVELKNSELRYNYIITNDLEKITNGKFKIII